MSESEVPGTPPHIVTALFVILFIAGVVVAPLAFSKYGMNQPEPRAAAAADKG